MQLEIAARVAAVGQFVPMQVPSPVHPGSLKHASASEQQDASMHALHTGSWSATLQPLPPPLPPVPPLHVPQPNWFTSPTHCESHSVVQQYES